METVSTMVSDLRALPSINDLLVSALGAALIQTYGRPLTLAALRAALDEVRTAFPNIEEIPGQEALAGRAGDLLAAWTAPSLQAVINATGVIIHTNLGRAPLSQAAIAAVQAAAAGYSTLEYDLDKGQRGSRLVHAESLLCRLTGAEAALAVNNNAAAVLLVLTALAKGRQAVIARTQLVEIGGGFRVPEVMEQSGAVLYEIGATNRVHLADYQAALRQASVPALVLRAHRSNFQIVGFTSEPALDEIAAAAHAAGVPLVDDLGSGSLFDTALYGMAHEPTVQESLATGADLVCFSGDKLLGGPQAGLIVGRRALVEQLKRHPLARAVRADKLCLAALSATLLHYLQDEALEKVPVWRMIAAPLEQLEARARQWAQALGTGEVAGGESTVGGGSLPGETLPTRLLSLAVPNPNAFLARLRRCRPPVIARVEADQVMLDPRTVAPEQDAALLQALRSCLSEI